ncbi:hypothetical protein D3C77_712200 [compost metagenome]
MRVDKLELMNLQSRILEKLKRFPSPVKPEKSASFHMPLDISRPPFPSTFVLAVSADIGSVAIIGWTAGTPSPK